MEATNLIVKRRSHSTIDFHMSIIGQSRDRSTYKNRYQESFYGFSTILWRVERILNLRQTVWKGSNLIMSKHPNISGSALLISRSSVYLFPFSFTSVYRWFIPSWSLQFNITLADRSHQSTKGIIRLVTQTKLLITLQYYIQYFIIYFPPQRKNLLSAKIPF